MIIIRCLVLFFINLIPFFNEAQTIIPKGEIRGPFPFKSKIYPGTKRDYWIYVPHKYDTAKPACLMVVQDGLSRAKGWNLPTVLDSLIEEKKVPSIIGVFVDHGTVPAHDKAFYPRYNRSLEYDAMGDRYSRFLLEELLPEISLSYNISSDPNDRSIAGASSGAICAFNVAWERPDQFRRVLSTIGTYVGLRGADEFATLIRKTEQKPLRIFLQDGSKDLNIYAGDWWMANHNMLSALSWAGYEVDHAWGDGGHDSEHTKTILADALVWLWKDYPTPIQTRRSLTTNRTNLFPDNEHWTEVPLKNIHADNIAVNNKGEVFISGSSSIFKLGNQGGLTEQLKLKGKASAIAFHHDGRLCISDIQQHKIMVLKQNGKVDKLINNVDANFLSISVKGIYFTDTAKEQIGFYSFSNETIRYTSVPFMPAGLAISAEQTFLNVGMSNHLFGYSFKITDKGDLDFGQPYIHYHVPYGQNSTAAAGMTVDAENRLYTATNLGIQISDQLGRVNVIVNKPGGGVTDVKLGGADLDVLYSTCDGKLFYRKINAKGVLPGLPPVKPTRPGL